MASLRSAGLLSISLLAAIGQAVPFSVVARSNDTCPYIPMSVDNGLETPWYEGNSTTKHERSMWVRTSEGGRVTTLNARDAEMDEIDGSLEKRASGTALWEFLNNALKNGVADEPCYQFNPDKWHDYQGPRGALPYKALRPIFSKLGLPVGEWPEHQGWDDRNYGKNQVDRVYHNLDLRYYEGGYNANDDETAVTGHFLQQMSVANGVIVAVENDRAVYSKPEGGVGFKVPANWKDTTWYQWQRLAGIEGSAVSNLKYIFRYNVDNGISKQVIVEAFGGDSIYDVKTFKPGDDQFFKLLGSPNASGVPKLLVANMNKLGKKTIESISIQAIHDADGAMYMMWLTLTGYKA